MIWIGLFNNMKMLQVLKKGKFKLVITSRVLIILNKYYREPSHHFIEIFFKICIRYLKISYKKWSKISISFLNKLWLRETIQVGIKEVVKMKKKN